MKRRNSVLAFAGSMAVSGILIYAVSATTPPPTNVTTQPPIATTRPADYWNMLSATRTPPLSTGIPAKCSFDMDDDSDVDQSDFGIFEMCLGKIQGNPNPKCAQLDLERDGEIGELEQIYFRLCSNDSAIPVDPACQTFELKGTLEKIAGAADSYRSLRFIGTGKFKGQDYCTMADIWGRYSIRIPAGWSGYYTISHIIDRDEQLVMGTFLEATKAAEEFDNGPTTRPAGGC